eukprot:3057268-Amphidinium_carterae.1
MSSPEDITTDLTLKAFLKLSNSHTPFNWLRKLPPALWAGKNPEGASERAKALRESITAMCERMLPVMANEPEKVSMLLSSLSLRMPLPLKLQRPPGGSRRLLPA